MRQIVVTLQSSPFELKSFLFKLLVPTMQWLKVTDVCVGYFNVMPFAPCQHLVPLYVFFQVLII